MHPILFKTGRRLKHYSKFYIPYNVKYKPAGVYPTVKEFVKHNPSEAEYQEIFPAFLSRLEVDQTFVDACPSYLKPRMEVKQPAAYIVTMKNGRIVTDVLGRNIAYISADNRLIGEISFQWEDGKILSPEKNKILKYVNFDQPARFEGTVFSMLSGAAGVFNYFHWFIDTFPKLYLAKKAGILNQIDWFLVPSYQYGFQKEYLALLGITEDKIIRGDRHPHIFAERLAVASPARGVAIHIPEWIPQFYREEILPKIKNVVKGGKRIYISRNDSSKRRVLNEEKLLDVLQKNGFEMRQLNGKSTEEQARIFASADFIVSPHGAGLANLVYCNPGTKVIEFFPGGYVKQTYYDLSNKCDLTYRYIIFEKTEVADNAMDGQKIHITADVDEIERNVKEMLEGKVEKVHGKQ